MRELSLHILDIVENSVKAGADLIKVNISAKNNIIKIEIIDNGSGMSSELLNKVVDPFTTTRTTRKVGMGIPLFKMAAETANGTFDIKSDLGKGTVVTATFEIDNIDRSPLGDIVSTIVTQLNENVDYIWRYEIENNSFVFDTREIKNELKGIPIDSPEIMVHIRDFLIDNIEKINGGKFL